MKDYPSSFTVWIACCAAFTAFASAVPSGSIPSGAVKIWFYGFGVVCAFRAVVEIYKEIFRK